MSSALLLFSGGQDSSVCLAWALSRYEQVETIGFDYGQRHRIELDCRHEVRQRLAALSPQWQSALGADHVLDLSVLGQISDTGLTRAKAIETDAQGLPTSFVPGRNLVFLSLAAALACNRQIQRLVAGVGEADYSGYPDCRADTIAHMQQALSAGLGQPIPIETPLMYLDKAEIWELAQTLGGVALNDIIGEHTHTCYLGERTQRHRWGYGCGACPACVLRARGWESWQAKQVQT